MVNLRASGAITILAICLSLVLGVLDARAADTVVLKQYPKLKLGMLAVNFGKPLPLTGDNALKYVDIAADLGFSWVEIRDPNAALSLEECKKLGAYAKSKKIALIYALGVGPLDPTFADVFAKGLANAKAMGSLKILRTALPGAEFAADPKKTAWTKDEFARLVAQANKGGAMAKATGFDYVVENAFETLAGDGQTTFGTTDFFKAVSPNVKLQMDTANFFIISRTPAAPGAAKAFMDAFAKNIRYIHLKGTSDGKTAQFALASGNPLDFGAVFACLSKNKAPWVGFELNQADTLDQCIANHKKSLEFLKNTY